MIATTRICYYNVNSLRLECLLSRIFYDIDKLILSILYKKYTLEQLHAVSYNFWRINFGTCFTKYIIENNRDTVILHEKCENPKI